MRYLYDESHVVEAAVIFCLDPRFSEPTREFIRGELNLSRFDQYVFPGGPKALVDEVTRTPFLQALGKVSVGLHHAERVVLIAHRDCGAYGGSRAFTDLQTERATQIGDLIEAKRIILEQYPQLIVDLFYLEIIGNEVEFQAV